jgi:glucosamine-6-phosphate deaminase
MPVEAPVVDDSGAGRDRSPPTSSISMPRRLSTLAPDWWDYTTLEPDLINDAAALTERDLAQLTRPGFRVMIYDTLEEFYLAEALEYITAWRQATADTPVGICGPIGPTEQLPLVARLVNELGLPLKDAHFWGMDEWYDGETRLEVPVTHPLAFERADRELCFDRVRPELSMPEANLHFPKADVSTYRASWRSGVRCAVMQGGQGDIKHWAFNDPPRRGGAHQDAPPTPAAFRALETRVVELHPVTLMQNARTSGGGNITMVPTQAITVGPVETWLAEKVSIWHAGTHDNPLGQRLTALMISKGIEDAAVPMSLLANHPNVQFNYFRGGLGTCAVEMH